MKWPLAMRTASLPDERWAKKEAEWNPGLSIKHKTWRLVGRPRKRWEDEINDFLKPEETEATKGNEIKNNDTWIKAAENRERWKEMENEYAIAAGTYQRAYLACRAGLSPRSRADFDWQGIQAFHDEPTMPAEQGMHQGVLGNASKKEKS